MIKKNIVIAIDGYASSGKGTIAKKLTKYFLSSTMLNTGGLYRYLAYLKKTHNLSLDILKNNIDKYISLINYNDFNKNFIQNEEIAKIASIISKDRLIREKLIPVQRDYIENSKNKYNIIILEGRDIGTIIYPKADYKFFFICDSEVRAKRRFMQIKESDQNIKYDDILREIEERDNNDINRDISPLKKAENAIEIDSSNKDIEETFKEVVKYLRF